MKNCKTPGNQTTPRGLLIACATALAVAFTASLPRLSQADRITPPSVPTDLQVPAGNKVFLVAHAVGTQQYLCRFTGWDLFGPQATLFDDDDKQVITHFLSPNPVESSPNPVESGLARPTWQHSKDTSTVWAKKNAESSDPDFVVPGAIPWLRLEVVGTQDGPTGGDKLSATTFIQRLNTSGGGAPSTGCTLPTDVGNRVLVDYETDYFFYRAADNDADDGD
jgi:hypothetical protein